MVKAIGHLKWPCLTQSRPKACALTTGYPGSLHKGFQKFEDALAYMHEHGKIDFFIDHEMPPVRKSSTKKHYAVANGRTNGVFSSYE